MQSNKNDQMSLFKSEISTTSTASQDSLEKILLYLNQNLGKLDYVLKVCGKVVIARHEGTSCLATTTYASLKEQKNDSQKQAGGSYAI